MTMHRRTVTVGARVVGDLDVAVTRSAQPDLVIGVADELGTFAGKHDRLDVQPRHGQPSSNPRENSRSRSCFEYTWKLIRVSVRSTPSTFAMPPGITVASCS